MNEYCYIISYKILSQDSDSQIQEAIRSYGTWARITSDTWAIVTTRKATEIRDHLQQFIHGGRIFVIKSGIEAAWNNVECSNEWLKRNL